MAGKHGIYHADPLFARFGVLKVGDLYRQQVRVHAWKFWNGRLPENQAAMLQRVDERHGHGTRAARGGGLALSSGDHRGVGDRVLTAWRSLSEEQRGMGQISRVGFLVGYGAFVYGVAGCRACQGGGAWIFFSAIKCTIIITGYRPQLVSHDICL